MYICYTNLPRGIIWINGSLMCFTKDNIITKESKRKEDYSFCEVCQDYRPLRIEAAYQYRHIYGFPLFYSSTKYYRITCKTCGDTIKFDGVNVTIIPWLHRTTIPWLHRFGWIFFWLLATTAIVVLNHFPLHQRFPMGWVITFAVAVPLIV